MTPIPSAAKCCGPQHLPEGEPSHGWSSQQLGQYAQLRTRQIVAGEKKLAPLYWQLGQALQLARKRYPHGQWCDYLQELAIDRPRASKALAIYRAFATVALVEPFTVEEAYARRLRTKRVQSTKRRSRKRSTARIPLARTLAEVARLAVDQLQDDTRLRPTDVRKMLALVVTTIDRLEAVRKRLNDRNLDESADRSPAPASPR